MQVKILLNPEGVLLPGKNNLDDHTNIWHELMNLIMDTAFARPSTSLSEMH
jgi:hypothetical protein